VVVSIAGDHRGAILALMDMDGLRAGGNTLAARSPGGATTARWNVGFAPWMAGNCARAAVLPMM